MEKGVDLLSFGEEERWRSGDREGTSGGTKRVPVTAIR